jgi:hypothetical protein
MMIIARSRAVRGIRVLRETAPILASVLVESSAVRCNHVGETGMVD